MVRFGPSVSAMTQTRYVGSGWGPCLHGCASSVDLIDINASVDYAWSRCCSGQSRGLALQASAPVLLPQAKPQCELVSVG